MTGVLALDVGGTKMAGGIVERDGTVAISRIVATPPGGSADELWRTAADLLDDVKAHYASDVTGIGIGCGGPMVWPQGLVSPLNIPGWRNFPLLERARERYAANGDARIHNDAVCVALAESRFGASRGHSTSLGMVVSTGVGGGIIADGRVVNGVSGNAGHIGHVVVDPDGPQCACGGRGCLEAIACGPALAAWAVAQGWRPIDAAGTSTARDVGESAAAGNDIAIAALYRAGGAIGVAAATVAALLDVAMIVVGGGVAQTGELLFGPARRSFARHAGLSFTRDVSIVTAHLGQQAGLIGAASLLWE